jgi:malonate-semialdehyde dehydrogenase (acetylating)/methylmalonate-semialdehyde dehydrogenase
MPKTIQHWIAGKDFTGSSTRTAKVWNPATGEVQAEVRIGCPSRYRSCGKSRRSRLPGLGRPRRR